MNTIMMNMGIVVVIIIVMDTTMMNMVLYHQNKIIKQMNRLLQDDVNLNRVCYFNSDDHDNDNDYKDDNDGYEDPEDVNGDDNHLYEYKKY